MEQSDTLESAEEGTGLLTHAPETRYQNPRSRWWMAGFVLFLATLVGISLLLTFDGKGSSKPQVRGVILLISDGFGPSSETIARNYVQRTQNKSIHYQLPLDKLLVGSSRTRSSSSIVTDSAAGATAFSCGIKTYNGAIGVNPQGIPCGTVLEAAKEKGFFTGLVATSRITHATPAAFAAHVSTREDEDAIALQELGNYTLGRNVDLMFGGGRCHFLSNKTLGSCRLDSIDPLETAKEIGWHVGLDRVSFDSLSSKSPLPLLQLFAEDHMNFELDRDPAVQPSLKEMAIKALHILDEASRHEHTGFFLMIEGSRSNDVAAHIHDILAYNDVIEAVKDFVDDAGDLVMISVSDHETGGVSGASYTFPIYDWFPEALVNIKHSSEYMASQIASYNGSSELSTFVIDTVFKNWLNIVDVDPIDVAFFLNETMPSVLAMTYQLSVVSSRYANIGWTTHGHTAVDVNLYAHGKHALELAGNHENTEIGEFIVRNLGLDLDSVTKELKNMETGSVGVASHQDSRLHYHLTR